MQLLAVAIPYLENLAKEGEEGQRKMRRITNYVGAGIGLMLSIGYYFIIRNMGALKYTDGFAGIFTAVVIIGFHRRFAAVHLAGQPDRFQGHRQRYLAADLRRHRGPLVFRLQCGDQHRGRAQNGETQFYIFLPALVVLALVAVIFVVVMTNAERRIPMQYAKRVVGRKMYGGQASYIPIKVNMTGVMPIIFASTLCSLPGLIFRFINLDAAAHPVSGRVLPRLQLQQRALSHRLCC